MKLLLVAFVLLTFGACSTVAQPAPHLQFFGYAGGGSEAALVQTSNYTNFVFFGTNPGDIGFQATMDRISAHGQKALLSIAPVFWDFSSAPPVLYPDWKARWDTWVATNPAAFVPSRVFAIEPFDEPMGWGIEMKGYEAVCAYIKATIPWVKILHVDGLSPRTKGNVAAYIHDGGKLPNVDIIAIDAYCIHPTDNAEYLSFISLYKDAFPGRQWFYVMDGFWDADHIKAFGTEINVMATVAEEYYQLAASDPDAIGIGVFIWEGGDTSNWIQSSAFPAFILDQQKSVGNRIISRPAVNHRVHQQGDFTPAAHPGRK